MDSRLRRNALPARWVTTAALSWAISMVGLPVAPAQPDLLATLRNGVKLRVQCSDPEFRWSRVTGEGKVLLQQIPVADIRYLRFSQTSVSSEAQQIGEWLNRLSSPDYHTRNSAELELTARGGPFLDLISNAQQTGSAEVRYRVNRVLEKLRSSKSKQVSADYDEVILATSAQLIRGDAGKWTPHLTYRGQPLEVSRDNLLLLESLRASGPESAPPPTVTRTWDQPAETFYAKGDTAIDFDSGRNEESFLTLEDVSHAFAFAGAVFSAKCTHPATVVTSGFRISQGRSGKNSAATMEVDSGDRYHGELRVDFCEPSCEPVPATVHKFGCYTSVVSGPREIVLNAFDRNGNLLARSEAIDKTSFVGVESRVPIAYVTLTPNTDLRMPVDQIDDDFAVDDLVFDVPVPDRHRVIGNRPTTYLVNGDRLTSESLSVESEQVRLRSPSSLTGDLTFPLREVHSLVWVQPDGAERSEGLWGVLRDGSIVPLVVDEDGRLRCGGFDDCPVERSDLAGVFGSKHVLRFAPSEDFAGSRTVVVNPTERWIVDNVDLRSDSVRWDASHAELHEPFTLTGSMHAPDKTSQFSLADAPSIWFQEPVVIPSQSGIIETVDRRRFVLGGQFGFELKGIDDQSLFVARENEQLEIPLHQVRMIQFPGP